jgi:hypothetical protein
MDLTKSDRIGWRKFLATEAGTKGMLELHQNIPTISKGDADSIIFDAGRVEGYRAALSAINNILSLEEQKDIKADQD